MAQRYFSFGGGVQSTAVLVLAAQGRVQYDAMLFANVGDDSENPATIEYVERVAKPYAAANGIELVELQKTTRGEPETLLQHIARRQKSTVIPTRTAGGAFNIRVCTMDFKLRVIAKYTKSQGATKGNRVTVALGISMDEIQRARTDSGIAWQLLEYPLLDLRMYRRDCLRIIAEAGLPQPPKSSCWFCPFRRREEWQTMKRENPQLFAQAVALEHMLNERRATLGRDEIYLHASLRPLEQAVGDQLVFEFPDDMPCDSGYCFV